MKTLVIGLLATFATMNLFAQVPAVEPQKKDAAQVEKTQPDGITLKGGKVWLFENGNAKVITEELWTKRGMQITPTGILVFESGEKAKLLEGDFVTMDGAVARPIPVKGTENEMAYNKK